MAFYADTNKLKSSIFSFHAVVPVFYNDIALFIRLRTFVVLFRVVFVCCFVLVVFGLEQFSIQFTIKYTLSYDSFYLA